jgi:hypothetical protein
MFENLTKCVTTKTTAAVDCVLNSYCENNCFWFSYSGSQILIPFLSIQKLKYPAENTCVSDTKFHKKKQYSRKLKFDLLKIDIEINYTAAFQRLLHNFGRAVIITFCNVSSSVMYVSLTSACLSLNLFSFLFRFSPIKFLEYASDLLSISPSKRLRVLPQSV